MITTAGIIRTFAAERPDHPALRWADGELTYRELHERSSRVAQALLAAGVGPGDHVCYLDKNSPEQVELFCGAAMINAVPTPVNFRLAPPEVATIVADAQAKIFAIGAEFEALVDKLRPELPGTTMLVIGGTDPATSYETWRDAHAAEDPGTEPADDDVAYQLYSSGTTGLPKGVQLTQRQPRRRPAAVRAV